MGAFLDVRVALVEPRWPDGAAGLLLPIPPATPHQRLVEWEAPRGWEWQTLCAKGRAQQAALVTRAVNLGEACRYRFEEVASAPEPRHYEPYLNRFTALPDGLRPLVQEIAAAAATERERVQRVVAYVASRFVYNPTPSTGAFPDVACDIKQGNCLDINTVFLSMLYALGIRASYDIGYYFKGDEPECDGWHCWVSLLADGEHQDWDVPHYLKWNVTPPIRKGLNPLPGRRVCMSRGRGNRFQWALGEVEVSHFCRPRWVLPDGTTREAPMRGTLLPGTRTATGS